MNPTDRPKGDLRSAPHEGSAVSGERPGMAMPAVDVSALPGIGIKPMLSLQRHPRTALGRVVDLGTMDHVHIVHGHLAGL